MTKVKRHKKDKFLWTMAGLLSATAIIAPVVTATSCGNNAKIQIDEVDREMGVSSATYDNMKTLMRIEYKNKLEATIESEEKIAIELADFDEKIHQFDNIVKDNLHPKTNAGTPVYNYTDITSALAKWSNDTYNIQLHRDSTMSFDDIRKDFDGMKDSCEYYMRNMEFIDEQEIQRILKNAQDKFDNEIFPEIKAEYPFDPLSAYIFGRPKIISCLEETCLDIAFMSAENRIQDFLDRYTFEFKENSEDESNRYDKMVSQFTPGQAIKKEQFNKMFLCVDKNTGQERPGGYDPDKMLPGYRVIPLFHAGIANAATNIYKIQVDWTIVSSTYIGTEDEYAATAHLYTSNASVTDDRETGESVSDNLHRTDSTIMYSDYEMLPSKEYERKQLYSYYFSPNPQGRIISFQWNEDPKNPENKYESFFEGVENGKFTGTLKITALGNSGMKISGDGRNYEKVNDVLYRLDGDERDDTQLSFVEKFIKYVNMTSDVNIVGKTHAVTHQFKYEYKNTVSDKHECVYVDPLERHTDGFLVSREFFYAANDAYNSGRRYFNIYFDNEFEDVYDNVLELHLTFVMNLASTAWQLAKAWLKMLCSLWECNIPMATREALMIGCIIAQGVFIGLAETLYQVYLIEPARSYVENTRKFNKESSFKELKQRINDDAQYFSIADKNNNYDPDDLEVKYKKFAELDFDDKCRPLYQFYTTLNVQPVCVEFQAKVKQYKIDPQDFKKTFSSWLYWGICKATNYGYSGARAVITGLFFWDWKRESWSKTLKFLEFAIETVLEAGIAWIIEAIIGAIIF